MLHKKMMMMMIKVKITNIMIIIMTGVAET
jgi:hypothetical protein